MTATPTRESHEFFFRVTGKDDVTEGDVTIAPRDVTIQFLAEDGVRSICVVVSGPDRNTDGTLSRNSGHMLRPARERWPRWVASRVAGCAPDGWGT